MTRRAGYSLFEVLLAFAILTTVLAVLLPGQSRLLHRMSQSEHKVLAQDYALSVLDSLGLENPVEPSLSRTTHLDWDVETEILPNPDWPHILRAHVTIRDDQGRIVAQAHHDLRSVP